MEDPDNICGDGSPCSNCDEVCKEAYGSSSSGEYKSECEDDEKAEFETPFGQKCCCESVCPKPERPVACTTQESGSYIDDGKIRCTNDQNQKDYWGVGTGKPYGDCPQECTCDHIFDYNWGYCCKAKAPPGGCFLAGTQVLMADSTSKNIEDVEVGDLVISYDETTGFNRVSPVIKKYIHNDTDKKYLIINGYLNVTPIHRLMVDGEWKQAGSLKIGDVLRDANGMPVAVSSIEEVQLDDYVTVYNLEVEKTNTYYADKVLAHNAKVVVTTTTTTTIPEELTCHDFCVYEEQHPPQAAGYEECEEIQYTDGFCSPESTGETCTDTEAVLEYQLSDYTEITDCSDNDLYCICNGTITTTTTTIPSCPSLPYTEKDMDFISAEPGYIFEVPEDTTGICLDKEGGGGTSGGAYGLPGGDHLVFSEVVVKMPMRRTEFCGEEYWAEPEYIEIYNPTNTAINLRDYYISDSNMWNPGPVVDSSNINIEDLVDIFGMPSSEIEEPSVVPGGQLISGLSTVTGSAVADITGAQGVQDFSVPSTVIPGGEAASIVQTPLTEPLPEAPEELGDAFFTTPTMPRQTAYLTEEERQQKELALENSTMYFKIVQSYGSGGGDWGDFHAKFPEGSIIGPGEAQTIALTGRDLFFNTYGVEPTYDLLTDMIEVFPGSIDRCFPPFLDNKGEALILYQWDEASDLVKDVDYLVYDVIDKSLLPELPPEPPAPGALIELPEEPLYPGLLEPVPGEPSLPGDIEQARPALEARREIEREGSLLITGSAVADSLASITGAQAADTGQTGGQTDIITQYMQVTSPDGFVNFLLYPDPCLPEEDYLGSKPENPEKIDKTGVSMDGPDLGSRKTEYAPDTPIHKQRPFIFNWWERLFIPEPLPGEPSAPGTLEPVPDEPQEPGEIIHSQFLPYVPVEAGEITTTTITTVTTIPLYEPQEPGDLGALAGSAVADITGAQAVSIENQLTSQPSGQLTGLSESQISQLRETMPVENHTDDNLVPVDALRSALANLNYPIVKPSTRESIVLNRNCMSVMFGDLGEPEEQAAGPGICGQEGIETAGPGEMLQMGLEAEQIPQTSIEQIVPDMPQMDSQMGQAYRGGGGEGLPEPIDMGDLLDAKWKEEVELCKRNQMQNMTSEQREQQLSDIAQMDQQKAAADLAAGTFNGITGTDVTGEPMDINWWDFLEANPNNGLVACAVCSARSNYDQECFCPEFYAPVCGSDGVTYKNKCEAVCADISNMFPGICWLTTLPPVSVKGEPDLLGPLVFAIQPIAPPQGCPAKLATSDEQGSDIGGDAGEQSDLQHRQINDKKLQYVYEFYAAGMLNVNIVHGNFEGDEIPEVKDLGYGGVLVQPGVKPDFYDFSDKVDEYREGLANNGQNFNWGIWKYMSEKEDGTWIGLNLIRGLYEDVNKKFVEDYDASGTNGKNAGSKVYQDYSKKLKEAWDEYAKPGKIMRKSKEQLAEENKGALDAAKETADMAGQMKDNPDSPYNSMKNRRDELAGKPQLSQEETNELNQLNRMLNGETPQQQRSRLRSEANDLWNQAEQARAAGDQDKADQLTDQYNQNQQRADELDSLIENAGGADTFDEQRDNLMSNYERARQALGAYQNSAAYQWAANREAELRRQGQTGQDVSSIDRNMQQILDQADELQQAVSDSMRDVGTLNSMAGLEQMMNDVNSFGSSYGMNNFNTNNQGEYTGAFTTGTYGRFVQQQQQAYQDAMLDKYANGMTPSALRTPSWGAGMSPLEQWMSASDRAMEDFAEFDYLFREQFGNEVMLAEQRGLFDNERERLGDLLQEYDRLDNLKPASDYNTFPEIADALGLTAEDRASLSSTNVPSLQGDALRNRLQQLGVDLNKLDPGNVQQNKLDKLKELEKELDKIDQAQKEGEEACKKNPVECEARRQQVANNVITLSEAMQAASDMYSISIDGGWNLDRDAALWGGKSVNVPKPKAGQAVAGAAGGAAGAAIADITGSAAAGGAADPNAFETDGTNAIHEDAVHYANVKHAQGDCPSVDQFEKIQVYITPGETEEVEIDKKPEPGATKSIMIGGVSVPGGARRLLRDEGTAFPASIFNARDLQRAYNKLEELSKQEQDLQNQINEKQDERAKLADELKPIQERDKAKNQERAIATGEASSLNGEMQEMLKAGEDLGKLRDRLAEADLIEDYDPQQAEFLREQVKQAFKTQPGRYLAEGIVPSRDQLLNEFSQLNDRLVNEENVIADAEAVLKADSQELQGRYERISKLDSEIELLVRQQQDIRKEEIAVLEQIANSGFKFLLNEQVLVDQDTGEILRTAEQKQKFIDKLVQKTRGQQQNVRNAYDITTAQLGDMSNDDIAGMIQEARFSDEQKDTLKKTLISQVKSQALEHIRNGRYQDAYRLTATLTASREAGGYGLTDYQPASDLIDEIKTRIDIQVKKDRMAELKRDAELLAQLSASRPLTGMMLYIEPGPGVGQEKFLPIAGAASKDMREFEAGVLLDRGNAATDARAKLEEWMELYYELPAEERDPYDLVFAQSLLEQIEYFDYQVELESIKATFSEGRLNEALIALEGIKAKFSEEYVGYSEAAPGARRPNWSIFSLIHETDLELRVRQLMTAPNRQNFLQIKEIAAELLNYRYGDSAEFLQENIIDYVDNALTKSDEIFNQGPEALHEARVRFNMKKTELAALEKRIQDKREQLTGFTWSPAIPERERELQALYQYRSLLKRTMETDEANLNQMQAEYARASTLFTDSQKEAYSALVDDLKYRMQLEKEQRYRDLAHETDGYFWNTLSGAGRWVSGFFSENFADIFREDYEYDYVSGLNEIENRAVAAFDSWEAARAVADSMELADSEDDSVESLDSRVNSQIRAQAEAEWRAVKENREKSGYDNAVLLGLQQREIELEKSLKIEYDALRQYKINTRGLPESELTAERQQVLRMQARAGVLRKWIELDEKRADDARRAFRSESWGYGLGLFSSESIRSLSNFMYNVLGLHDVTDHYYNRVAFENQMAASNFASTEYRVLQMLNSMNGKIDWGDGPEARERQTAWEIAKGKLQVAYSRAKAGDLEGKLWLKREQEGPEGWFDFGWVYRTGLITLSQEITGYRSQWESGIRNEISTAWIEANQIKFIVDAMEKGYIYADEISSFAESPAEVTTAIAERKFARETGITLSQEDLDSVAAGTAIREDILLQKYMQKFGVTESTARYVLMQAQMSASLIANGLSNARRQVPYIRDLSANWEQTPEGTRLISRATTVGDERLDNLLTAAGEFKAFAREGSLGFMVNVMDMSVFDLVVMAGISRIIQIGMSAINTWLGASTLYTARGASLIYNAVSSFIPGTAGRIIGSIASFPVHFVNGLLRGASFLQEIIGTPFALSNKLEEFIQRSFLQKIFGKWLAEKISYGLFEIGFEEGVYGQLFGMIGNNLGGLDGLGDFSEMMYMPGRVGISWSKKFTSTGTFSVGVTVDVRQTITDIANYHNAISSRVRPKFSQEIEGKLYQAFEAYEMKMEDGGKFRVEVLGTAGNIQGLAIYQEDIGIPAFITNAGSDLDLAFLATPGIANDDLVIEAQGEYINPDGQIIPFEEAYGSRQVKVSVAEGDLQKIFDSMSAEALSPESPIGEIYLHLEEGYIAYTERGKPKLIVQQGVQLDRAFRFEIGNFRARIRLGADGSPKVNEVTEVVRNLMLQQLASGRPNPRLVTSIQEIFADPATGIAPENNLFDFFTQKAQRQAVDLLATRVADAIKGKNGLYAANLMYETGLIDENYIPVTENPILRAGLPTLLATAKLQIQNEIQNQRDELNALESVYETGRLNDLEPELRKKYDKFVAENPDLAAQNFDMLALFIDDKATGLLELLKLDGMLKPYNELQLDAAIAYMEGHSHLGVDSFAEDIADKVGDERDSETMFVPNLQERIASLLGQQAAAVAAMKEAQEDVSQNDFIDAKKELIVAGQELHDIAYQVMGSYGIDSATGLPALQTAESQEVKNMQQNPGVRQVAVFEFGKQMLKAANREGGHDLGTDLIRRTADVLQKYFAGMDVTISRQGGSFVVIGDIPVDFVEEALVLMQLEIPDDAIQAALKLGPEGVPLRAGVSEFEIEQLDTEAANAQAVIKRKIDTALETAGSASEFAKQLELGVNAFRQLPFADSRISEAAAQELVQRLQEGDGVNLFASEFDAAIDLLLEQGVISPTERDIIANYREALRAAKSGVASFEMLSGYVGSQALLNEWANYIPVETRPGGLFYVDPYLAALQGAQENFILAVNNLALVETVPTSAEKIDAFNANLQEFMSARDDFELKLGEFLEVTSRPARFEHNYDEVRAGRAVRMMDYRSGLEIMRKYAVAGVGLRVASADPDNFGSLMKSLRQKISQDKTDEVYGQFFDAIAADLKAYVDSQQAVSPGFDAVLVKQSGGDEFMVAVANGNAEQTRDIIGSIGPLGTLQPGVIQNAVSRVVDQYKFDVADPVTGALTEDAVASVTMGYTDVEIDSQSQLDAVLENNDLVMSMRKYIPGKGTAGTILDISPGQKNQMLRRLHQYAVSGNKELAFEAYNFLMKDSYYWMFFNDLFRRALPEVVSVLEWAGWPTGIIEPGAAYETPNLDPDKADMFAQFDTQGRVGWNTLRAYLELKYGWRPIPVLESMKQKVAAATPEVAAAVPVPVVPGGTGANPEAVTKAQETLFRTQSAVAGSQILQEGSPAGALPTPSQADRIDREQEFADRHAQLVQQLNAEPSPVIEEELLAAGNAEEVLFELSKLESEVVQQAGPVPRAQVQAVVEPDPVPELAEAVKIRYPGAELTDEPDAELAELVSEAIEELGIRSQIPQAKDAVIANAVAASHEIIVPVSQSVKDSIASNIRAIVEADLGAEFTEQKLQDIVSKAAYAEEQARLLQESLRQEGVIVDIQQARRLWEISYGGEGSIVEPWNIQARQVKERYDWENGQVLLFAGKNYQFGWDGQILQLDEAGREYVGFVNKRTPEGRALELALIEADKRTLYTPPTVRPLVTSCQACSFTRQPDFGKEAAIQHFGQDLDAQLQRAGQYPALGKHGEYFIMTDQWGQKWFVKKYKKSDGWQRINQEYVARNEVFVRKFMQDMGFKLGTPVTFSFIGADGLAVTISRLQEGFKDLNFDFHKKQARLADAQLAEMAVLQMVLGLDDFHGGNIMADADFKNIKLIDFEAAGHIAPTVERYGEQVIGYFIRGNHFPWLDRNVLNDISRFEQAVAAFEAKYADTVKFEQDLRQMLSESGITGSRQDTYVVNIMENAANLRTNIENMLDFGNQLYKLEPPVLAVAARAPGVAVGYETGQSAVASIDGKLVMGKVVNIDGDMVTVEIPTRAGLTRTITQTAEQWDRWNEFRIGQTVDVMSDRGILGGFQIVGITADGRYQLERPDMTATVSAAQLRAWGNLPNAVSIQTQEGMDVINYVENVDDVTAQLRQRLAEKYPHLRSRSEIIDRIVEMYGADIAGQLVEANLGLIIAAARLQQRPFDAVLNEYSQLLAGLLQTAPELISISMQEISEGFEVQEGRIAISAPLVNALAQIAQTTPAAIAQMLQQITPADDAVSADSAILNEGEAISQNEHKAQLTSAAFRIALPNFLAGAAQQDIDLLVQAYEIGILPADFLQNAQLYYTQEGFMASLAARMQQVTVSDLPGIIDPALMAELVNLNGGKPLTRIEVSGDAAENIGNILAQLQNIPGNEYVAIYMQNQVDGDVQYHVVVDTAANLLATPLQIVRPATWQFQFIFTHSVQHNLIEWDAIYLGENLRRTARPGTSFAEDSFVKFAELMVRYYPGMEIATHAINPISAAWMQEFFNAQQLTPDQFETYQEIFKLSQYESYSDIWVGTIPAQMPVAPSAVAANKQLLASQQFNEVLGGASAVQGAKYVYAFFDGQTGRIDYFKHAGMAFLSEEFTAPQAVVEYDLQGNVLDIQFPVAVSAAAEQAIRQTFASSAKKLSPVEMEKGVVDMKGGVIHISDAVTKPGAVAAAKSETDLAENIEDSTDANDDCKPGGSIGCTKATRQGIRKACQDILAEAYLMNALFDAGYDAQSPDFAANLAAKGINFQALVDAYKSGILLTLAPDFLQNPASYMEDLAWMDSFNQQRRQQILDNLGRGMSLFASPALAAQQQRLRIPPTAPVYFKNRNIQMLTNARRVVAVGDLHGTYDKMVKILEKAGIVTLDAQNNVVDIHFKEGDVVVFDGDLVDRGDAKKVIDLSARLMQAAGDKAVVVPLYGNHDYAMQRAINQYDSMTDAEKADLRQIMQKGYGALTDLRNRGWNAWASWVLLQGVSTIDSYGGIENFLAAFEKGTPSRNLLDAMTFSAVIDNQWYSHTLAERLAEFLQEIKSKYPASQLTPEIVLQELDAKIEAEKENYARDSFLYEFMEDAPAERTPDGRSRFSAEQKAVIQELGRLIGANIFGVGHQVELSGQISGEDYLYDAQGNIIGTIMHLDAGLYSDDGGGFAIIDAESQAVIQYDVTVDAAGAISVEQVPGKFVDMPIAEILKNEVVNLVELGQALSVPANLAAVVQLAAFGQSMTEIRLLEFLATGDSSWLTDAAKGAEIITMPKSEIADLFASFAEINKGYSDAEIQNIIQTNTLDEVAAQVLRNLNNRLKLYEPAISSDAAVAHAGIFESVFRNALENTGLSDAQIGEILYAASLRFNEQALEGQPVTLDILVQVAVAFVPGIAAPAAPSVRSLEQIIADNPVPFTEADVESRLFLGAGDFGATELITLKDRRQYVAKTPFSIGLNENLKEVQVLDLIKRNPPAGCCLADLVAAEPNPDGGAIIYTEVVPGSVEFVTEELTGQPAAEVTSLFTLLLSPGPYLLRIAQGKAIMITEESWQDFRQQIQSLNEMGIIHSDMQNLANILVNTQTGELYLIDFGMAFSPAETAEMTQEQKNRMYEPETGSGYDVASPAHQQYKQQRTLVSELGFIDFLHDVFSAAGLIETATPQQKLQQWQQTDVYQSIGNPINLNEIEALGATLKLTPIEAGVVGQFKFRVTVEAAGAVLGEYFFKKPMFLSNELASEALDEALQTNMIPGTRRANLVVEGQVVEGMMTDWITEQTGIVAEQAIPGTVANQRYEADRVNGLMLDFISAQLDRGTPGNSILDINAKTWFIDNELSFIGTDLPELMLRSIGDGSPYVQDRHLVYIPVRGYSYLKLITNEQLAQNLRDAGLNEDGVQGAIRRKEILVEYFSQLEQVAAGQRGTIEIQIPGFEFTQLFTKPVQIQTINEEAIGAPVSAQNIKQGVTADAVRNGAEASADLMTRISAQIDAPAEEIPFMVESETESEDKCRYQSPVMFCEITAGPTTSQEEEAMVESALEGILKRDDVQKALKGAEFTATPSQNELLVLAHKNNLLPLQFFTDSAFAKESLSKQDWWQALRMNLVQGHFQNLKLLYTRHAELSDLTTPADMDAFLKEQALLMKEYGQQISDSQAVEILSAAVPGYTAENWADFNAQYVLANWKMHQLPFVIEDMRQKYPDYPEIFLARDAYVMMRTGYEMDPSVNVLSILFSRRTLGPDYDDLIEIMDAAMAGNEDDYEAFFSEFQSRFEAWIADPDIESDIRALYEGYLRPQMERAGVFESKKMLVVDTCCRSLPAIVRAYVQHFSPEIDVKAYFWNSQFRDMSVHFDEFWSSLPVEQSGLEGFLGYVDVEPFVDALNPQYDLVPNHLKALQEDILLHNFIVQAESGKPPAFTALETLANQQVNARIDLDAYKVRNFYSLRGMAAWEIAANNIQLGAKTAQQPTGSLLEATLATGEPVTVKKSDSAQENARISEEMRFVSELNKRGIPGTPQLRGFVQFEDGTIGIVYSHVEGQIYKDAKSQMTAEQKQLVYNQLKNIVQMLNDNGFHNNRLFEENVIITPDGDVIIADWGSVGFEQSVVSDSEALERYFNPQISTWAGIWQSVTEIAVRPASESRAEQLHEAAVVSVLKGTELGSVESPATGQAISEIAAEI